MANKGASRKGKYGIWLWVFLVVSWACIILAGYHFRLHEHFIGNVPPAATAPTVEQKTAEFRPCDAEPPQKGKVSVANAIGYEPNSSLAAIEVGNKHHFPVLIKFIDSKNIDTALYADSGAKGRVELRTGSYRLVVESGNAWCNLETGFNDGYALDYRERVAVSEGVLSGLQFTPIGPGPEDMIMTFTAGGQNSVAGGDDQPLSLSRQMDGHFHVAGRLNGHPITFMVDTGASKTAISYQTAKLLGLDRKCTPRKFRTAGGVVSGCMVRAEELRFGSFVLRHIDVTFNPSNEMSLLGMNVLSQFRIQQLDNTMLISNINQ